MAASVKKNMTVLQKFGSSGFLFANKCVCRQFSSSKSLKKGLVVGVYEPKQNGDSFELTVAGRKFDEQIAGNLSRQLKSLKKEMKKNDVRLFYGLDQSFPSVSVVCLGKRGETGYDEIEVVDKTREQIRTAVSNGVKSLRDVGETEVEVDACGDAMAAAEGSFLGTYEYDELKCEKNRKPKVISSLFEKSDLSRRKALEEKWQKGKILAEGQNFARTLMEMPSNLLTPTKFAELVKTRLETVGNISVIVRDQSWAEAQQMGSFISVAKGSEEPLQFMEIEYKGGQSEGHFALVGKGVTFDSGGISIKPSASMDEMRADMGGAACVAGSLLAAAKLKLPINIKAYIPLCENMPSGKATRPGDVVTAMNGKTIQVDNTDAEGRLILADALCYAEAFKPEGILNMATLTGAIDVALGGGASGAFTNSTQMWSMMEKAGAITGDRVWRMPLFDLYTSQVTKSQLADVNNIGNKTRSGGSCTAAAFLREFVTNKNWMHLDIAGVMKNTDEVPYLSTGMAGRPTRTVAVFLALLSKAQNSEADVEDLIS